MTQKAMEQLTNLENAVTDYREAGKQFKQFRQKDVEARFNEMTPRSDDQVHEMPSLILSSRARAIMSEAAAILKEGRWMGQ